MVIKQMKDELLTALNPNRYLHSVGVMDTAVLLAGRFGEDKEKASIAGLLHDCAREIKGDAAIALCAEYEIRVDRISRYYPVLLHAPLGAEIAKRKYGVEDQEILDAIACHTIGRARMSRLDKIIYLADYIEPNRCFPEVDKLREVIFDDLEKGMLYAINSSIKHVIDKGAIIHPGTIMCRNCLIGLK